MRRTLLIGIASAVLLAAGIALAVPAAWQVLVVDPAAARAQQAAAGSLLHRLAAAAPARPARGVPVEAEPARPTAVIGVLRVPRFGAGWRRVVRQGIDPETVLNSFTAGVGHYPGTGMPGERGNFAIAGHDTGWGDAFRRLPALRAGDRVELTAAAGTWVYRIRNLESVRPDAGEVLAPVPHRPHAAPRARLITLTTCDPPYHAQERLIAYGAFDRFIPAR